MQLSAYLLWIQEVFLVYSRKSCC